MDAFLAAAIAAAVAGMGSRSLAKDFPDATGWRAAAVYAPVIVGVAVLATVAFLTAEPLGWMVCSAGVCAAGVYLASEVK